ncbi:MAG: CDP-alcohol phosphatidyltransferase family protein, partial [Candidatus Tectomicrobia bacterium]|nr:CDP-alcohol phosphatidyltransferase family protein [Candidatus Tectomicrobia bacterium]
MVFARINRSYYERLLSPLLKALSRLRIHPNALTVIGLLINGVAAVQFANGRVRWGGLLILGAGIFDYLDGALARYSRRTSPFGAFLDSTIDRYSDMTLLTGILIFFMRQNEAGLVLLTCATLAGFVMVSYTRARAESLIPDCTVGLMERAERLILLSL